MNANKQPRNLQEALNKLNAYTYSVETDIRLFLDTPEDFNAAEYFEDVLIAAQDVRALVQWLKEELYAVRGEMK